MDATAEARWQEVLFGLGEYTPEDLGALRTNGDHLPDRILRQWQARA